MVDSGRVQFPGTAEDALVEIQRRRSVDEAFLGEADPDLSDASAEGEAVCDPAARGAGSAGGGLAMA